MEKTYLVYKYTNMINGKIYIGQTSKSLEERCGCNGRNYSHSSYFYSAICKYGWENFSHEIKQKISDKNSRPIQCIETGIVYKNKQEAAIAVGLKSSRSIMSALTESWRTAGTDKISGIKYHWKYFSEVRE